MTRKCYPYTRFIRIWQTSSSIANVVARTGLSRNSVHRKQKELTGNGVRLKKLAWASKAKTLWSALALYAKSFEDKTK